MATVAVDTVLLKTASRCNLDCTYCYVYQMDDDGWRKQPKRMSAPVIEAVIDQLGKLAQQQSRPFSVSMHGGEPLMLGISGMEALIAGLRAVLPASCTLNVQTNGVLLSDRLIELFAAHDVGVSISYDGPAEVHDAVRVDKRGQGSHDRVLAGINRLKSHPSGKQLWSGVLAVVDPKSDPAVVYRSLKSTGARGIDFLYRDGNRNQLPAGKSRIDSTEFGEWMCGLLRVYFADPTPPRIRVLDDLMRLVLGAKGRKEGTGVTDYGIIVIDTDGTITKNDTLKVAHRAADRFENRWSVLDRNLSEILATPEMAEYHELQRPTSPVCATCSELSVCGGGMPAHRWSSSAGFDNPSVFCADQKLLIAELRRYLAAAKAAA